jgi:hypothetical protein
MLVTKNCIRLHKIVNYAKSSLKKIEPSSDNLFPRSRTQSPSKKKCLGRDLKTSYDHLKNKVSRRDIHHNDTQRNDTQHKQIEHNDTQHDDTQHNDTQNNDTQHKRRSA